MLSLTDNLHEKYQFTDGEYKEFVEALGGKKKPLDVKNAKFVRITYDRIEASINYQDDDLEPIAAVGKYQTILEVIDTPDREPMGSGQPLIHLVTGDDSWETVPKSFSLAPTCTVINTAELKNLAYLATRPHPYKSLGPALEMRINGIEILTTKTTE